MRKILVLPLLFLLVLGAGCSEIPENDDPVIGVWAQLQAPKEASAKHMDREEWIFNDAYLGRYHRYQGNEITVSSDFQWESANGVYTISYPGLAKGADQVTIKESAGTTLLVDLEGQVLAYRE
jgi:hypothetical protein